MTWTLMPAAGFGAHARQWDALQAQTVASPMLQADFVAALLDAFSNGDELLAISNDAMAIVRPHGRGSWATFQPAQAPLGMWIERPGLDRAGALASLLRALPGVGLVLGLTQLDPLLAPAPDDAMEYIQTARITVAGSFVDYWAARGKNLRSNLKKQRAKLTADGVDLRLQTSTRADQMLEAVRDFGRLESAGWKAQAGTAVHLDNAQGRFYSRMLAAFAARGAASVYRYWFGDQLVAMDLCIRQGDCIVVLKTTYDESVPKTFSPALLMREDAVRALFDEGGTARIEFYGKVMEWHTRWTEQVRTLYHLNQYRWAALRRLHALSK
ncbi:GNAT family N-acetyltransferase [Massilia sp. S19_KUP03_FR1]|uniref:GNAT family N-acetyltransferase n=1 Tax=Massilia sp. S19_KUP03_FR1 TaxID=3025503 RepID=UPI002FCD6C29